MIPLQGAPARVGPARTPGGTLPLQAHCLPPGPGQPGLLFQQRLSLLPDGCSVPLPRSQWPGCAPPGSATVSQGPAPWPGFLPHLTEALNPAFLGLGCAGWGPPATLPSTRHGGQALGLLEVPSAPQPKASFRSHLWGFVPLPQKQGPAVRAGTRLRGFLHLSFHVRDLCRHDFCGKVV